MRFITSLFLFTGLMFCKAQAQSIQSVTPNTGKRNTSLLVTISGSNTHFTNSSSTVTFFWQGSPTAFVIVYISEGASKFLKSNLFSHYYHLLVLLK